MPYIKGAYSKYETAYAVALICVITSCRVGHNYRSYTCYSTKCMKFRILGIYPLCRLGHYVEQFYSEISGGISRLRHGFNFQLFLEKERETTQSFLASFATK